jgi:hypothetical protein
MAVRMRWTDTGADLITPTPRPGATMRSIAEPRRKATHVYMCLRNVDVPTADGANPHGGEFDRGGVRLSG